ncbi:unnamed protein product, partial [Durusdinium trenchii]
GKTEDKGAESPNPSKPQEEKTEENGEGSESPIASKPQEKEVEKSDVAPSPTAKTVSETDKETTAEPKKEHEHHLEHEDGELHEFNETAHLVELEAEEEEEHVHEEEKEEEPQKEEELGPPINIYKPVTPYEVNWEILDTPEPQSGAGGAPKRAGKVTKTKVIKGRCQWRNPVGFMCSTDISEAEGQEPWPNDMFAVYTTTQGGDSKDMSWVEGVTLLSSEEHNLIAFVLLMAFLRDHQDFYVDVDLMDGRIHSLKLGERVDPERGSGSFV